jgi:hypothetical protein
MKFIKFMLSQRYRDNLTHEFLEVYNESEDNLEVAYEEPKKK